MGIGADAAASVELLAHRAARVAPELADASLAAFPPVDGFAHLHRWTVSGLGASEAPARLLVGQLLRLGMAARFVPVSAFLAPDAPAGDVLVVFSQRLSPNARIPLRDRARRSFRKTVVVTSIGAEDEPILAQIAEEGGLVLRHGPTEEDGLVLRVVGPALATLAALRLALGLADARRTPLSWGNRLAEVSAAAGHAGTLVTTRGARADIGPSAIVLAGDDGELTTGLRMKLLEGLGISDVVVCDPCALVHGPLQAFFESHRTVFFLEETGVADLRERLEHVLVPDRHRLVRIAATLPRPLATFEWAAAFDALVVAALHARPRDLARWPGKGRDGAIYALDGT